MFPTSVLLEILVWVIIEHLLLQIDPQHRNLFNLCSCNKLESNRITFPVCVICGDGLQWTINIRLHIRNSKIFFLQDKLAHKMLVVDPAQFGQQKRNQSLSFLLLLYLIHSIPDMILSFSVFHFPLNVQKVHAVINRMLPFRSMCDSIDSPLLIQPIK